MSLRNYKVRTINFFTSKDKYILLEDLVLGFFFSPPEPSFSFWLIMTLDFNLCGLTRKKEKVLL